MSAFNVVSNSTAVRVMSIGTFGASRPYVAAYYSPLSKLITVSFRENPKVASKEYGNLQPNEARKLAIQLLELADEADEMERK